MLNNLHQHLSEWGLSDPQFLLQTHTSHLYTVRVGSDIAVLKLLTDMGQADEHNGALALRIFDGQGAVRLLQHDKQAHLIEYVDGGDLIPLVERGQDEEATRIIAEVLNRLHACTSDQSNHLTPLREWFRNLFMKANIDKQAGIPSIFTRAATVAESLLANPQDEGVLHGDIHHQNIRYHSQRGWLAFDPKGLYGERTYDAANTLCNPINMPHLLNSEARLLKNASILSEHLHIELSRLLSFVFVYAALSASWSLEVHGNPQSALRIAEICEQFVYHET